MNILVTGGAGFIGSNIVDRLISNGHDVTVIDNESSESNSEFYWNEKAINHKIDICEYEMIRPLFDGIDFVLHLAAATRIQPAILNPMLSVKTNSLGTATVLQCSREAKVKRVIYSSTSSAYGKNKIPNAESQANDCLNPYSVSKVSGEELCKMYYNLFKLETVILRYFNIYGNREPTKGQYAPVIGIFKRQKQDGLPLTIVGDGEQRRDFTSVEDVIEANIRAMEADLPEDIVGTIFNIGTGINYSIKEIASMIDKNSVHIPPRIGESRETLADASKAKKYLNWEAKINLKNYLNPQQDK